METSTEVQDKRAPWRWWGVLVAVAVMLVMAVATAAGTGDRNVVTVVDTPQDVVVEEREATVEKVTMSIDLEDGGAIDVDVPDANVVVDTWRGDDVLVIVEKTRGGRALENLADPINIQVSRRGRDVRIAALRGADVAPRGYELNFTILVPEHRSDLMHSEVKDTYSLAKLTSVLWRTLGKEVLKWVAF